MFSYFLRRELKERYLGNITGISWVFIQPLITLGIYWFIFDKIFKARIPEADEYGFIVYLAIGFWPWMAFSESIITSITSITDKADLIGKVKVNPKILVFSSITSTFFLNMIGYIVVLIVVIILNPTLSYSILPLLLIPIVLLYVFALSLGLILSSLQIFIRDTLQLMTTIITLWFFSTPIIYSEQLIPKEYSYLFQFNPVYTPINYIHKVVFSNEQLPWINMFYFALFVFILFYLATKVFDKLSPYFEDYI